jgi:hypothetical protein
LFFSEPYARPSTVDLLNFERHDSMLAWDVRWVRGYFPESAASTEIGNISFAHIDLDIYKSTAETLDYLHPRFIDRSIVVFDDYLRNADGVMKAVREFSVAHPDWATFPIFPGQGLMIHRSWFG